MEEYLYFKCQFISLICYYSRIGENGCAAYLTVATFHEDQTNNQAQTLDLDHILRTHHHQKSSELAKFHEAARNRNQRNKPVRNYFNTGKKPSYGDGQPFFKPKSYLSHSVRRALSPLATGGNHHRSSPVAKDRFHWVCNNGEMVAAAQ